MVNLRCYPQLCRWFFIRFQTVKFILEMINNRRKMFTYPIAIDIWIVQLETCIGILMFPRARTHLDWCKHLSGLELLLSKCLNLFFELENNLIPIFCTLPNVSLLRSNFDYCSHIWELRLTTPHPLDAVPNETIKVIVYPFLYLVILLLCIAFRRFYLL